MVPRPGQVARVLKLPLARRSHPRSALIPYLELRFRGLYVCGSGFEERQALSRGYAGSG
jgi:hypothetical protein